MNKIILKGRLAKDVEKRKTFNDVDVVVNSIAVNRKKKDDNGNYLTDFFNIIAFGKIAEFISKYFSKGQEILIEGRLQNKSWEDQYGQKKYGTEVIIESVEFCGNKKTEESINDGDFIEVDVDDDDLPF